MTNEKTTKKEKYEVWGVYTDGEDEDAAIESYAKTAKYEPCILINAEGKLITLY